jgi:hypothetical protein
MGFFRLQTIDTVPDLKSAELSLLTRPAIQV